MKAKLGLVCGLMLVSASAFAGEYQCDVNCVSRSGSIQQTVGDGERGQCIRSGQYCG